MKDIYLYSRNIFICVRSVWKVRKEYEKLKMQQILKVKAKVVPKVIDALRVVTPKLEQQLQLIKEFRK